MDKEELAKWVKAGKLAAEALEFGSKLIKPGDSLLEVTDKIENYIINKGGGLAFPVQMALNHVAAHFYPDNDDTTVFEDQVVKLDVGVHIDGYIGDNARTIDLSGNYAELVKASRDALNNAIKIAKAGTSIGQIGAVIQDTITEAGFAPVRNLSGHGLEQYDVHCAPTIPNTAINDHTPLETGQVIAIEPFASTGAGIVIETSNATLFQVAQYLPVREQTTRHVLHYIEQFDDLPFAKRWLEEEFPPMKLNFALKRMLNAGVLQDFPPLADKAKGIVSQAEHTLLVEEDSCKVLTKLD